MSGTGPFREETAFLISIEQAFLYFLVHRRISQIQQRKQTAERIPKTGIRVHIPRQHLPVVGTVVYHLPTSIYLIELAGEQQRAIQAGIKRAVLVQIPSVHFNSAQHLIPGRLSFFGQHLQAVIAQFLQVFQGLLHTDKRRSHPCMHLFPLPGRKPDNGSCMVCLLFCFIYRDTAIGNRRLVRKRLIEFDDEIIFEILRYSPTVFGGITDDAVVRCLNLYV